MRVFFVVGLTVDRFGIFGGSFYDDNYVSGSLTAVGLGRVMNKHSYTWHIAEVVTGCAIKSVGVMTRKDSNVYIARLMHSGRRNVLSTSPAICPPNLVISIRGPRSQFCDS